MNHSHTAHSGHAHHHPSGMGHPAVAKKDNYWKLALSATLHCLLGCGLGEVGGMVIGTWLDLSNHSTMLLAIILGFVMGFALGMLPLLRAGYPLRQAFKQVLVAEGLSIAVMESVELLVQVYSPGVMNAHLHEWLFWKGMLLGLLAGFVAAYPVNYYFVRKGVRHHH